MSLQAAPLPAGTAPLFGLVLAGGRSTRMGEDKALLQYAGESQLDRAMRLLVPHVQRAFVSARPDQAADAARARHPLIVDELEGLGPLAGILAALQAHPHAAWLVLACDLPFLDESTVGLLVAARDPARHATAFRSAAADAKHRDADGLGLPEPLCAIYEPGVRASLAAWAAAGRSCPRKFLLQADTLLLDLPRPGVLENVNTREEYAGARAQLAAGPQLQLKVQYFAILREQAGRREEPVTTAARTPAELYAELTARHRFSLPQSALKVAVNGEFGEWSAPLKSGDAVVFIPPVAGG